jgi:prepilin-type N-terminal cleavage/methylation domain-containing protein
MVPYVPLRGFTLIELLVVIAIIGILSSVVLVAIGSAKSSGADAGMKGNLDTIRKQAEIYAINTGSYGTQGTTTGSAVNCSAVSGGMWGDALVKRAIISAEGNAGTPAGATGIGGNVGVKSVCGSGNSYWAVGMVMKSNLAKVWCIDSLGRAKEINFSTIDDISENFRGCI